MAKQKKAATKTAGKSSKKTTAQKSTTKKSAPKKTAGKAAPKKTAGKAVAKKTVSKKAVAKKVTPSSVSARATKPASAGALRSFSLADAGIAILDVTFRDVGAGLSDITATFNGEEKSLNASGSISFNGVQKDDIIGIDGSSAGSTEIRISLPATPQQMNFSPGSFNDNFIIN